MALAPPEVLVEVSSAMVTSQASASRDTGALGLAFYLGYVSNYELEWRNFLKIDQREVIEMVLEYIAPYRQVVCSMYNST